VIRTVIVPIDRSSASQAVLPFLPPLLAGSNAEVVLVSARPWFLEGQAWAFSPSVPEETDLQKQIKETLSRTAAGGVRLVSLPGLPVEVILQVAKSERGTMIAMGTHARRGLRRLLLGSVAEQVLRESDIPVLAVPLLRPAPRAGETGFRKILVSFERGRDALCLLQPVAELSRLFDSEVLLLRSSNGLSNGGEPSSEIDLEVLFKKWGVNVRSHERMGDARDLVPRIAKAFDTDLVVLAHRPQAPSAAPTRTRIVGAILRTTGRPVLVVRDRSRVRVAEAPGARWRAS
jgi:nucleotide-binding universal stress UspA family protein